jgi:long-subunit acyl-CoA synthetase (AMP-forming)
MKIIMSCPFYEGYGQTENTALAFATNSQDPMGGHVGGIAVNNY